MKLTEEQVREMLVKAKSEGACDESVSEIEALLKEGGAQAVLDSKRAPEWAV